MKQLKVNEIYSTVQGEGPRVGVPTTFVRFSGCNMRCPGWPCDTPYAIFPEIWKHDPTMMPGEIMAKIAEKPGHNVCITGGEPTMQPEDLLEELVEIVTDDHRTIDMFSNGSLKPFPSWTRWPNVSVIMDWKLQGSGEAERGLDVRDANLDSLEAKDAVKFVVADEEDLEEALHLWKSWGVHKVPVYVGVAWGLIDEAIAVNWVLAHDLPWRLNVQVHKYVWPGVDRGI